jgi:hypothetical protein
MERDSFLRPAAKMPNGLPTNNPSMNITEAASTIIAQAFFVASAIYFLLVVTLARRNDDE